MNLSDKINVGILIFGDPTRGGTIASEVKFLSSLKEHNPDTAFTIITINPSVTKRVFKEKHTSYNFPHEILPMFDESRFYLLSHFDCIVTYPGHSNFFGGYLNDNIVKMYKIVSECTNVLKIPVFIRINDSEIKVRDYRHMCTIRLKGKPESAFMKDPANVKKAEDIVSWKTWDYSKVFWFANGSKKACDWVAETMFDREDETMRMAPRQTFVDNTIYVSDDIFFLVRKNYERFKTYDTLVGQPTDSLCYIGFFDTVNVMRAKALSILFKENRYNIHFKIFGKGTEILTKLAGKENITIEEGYLQGDSPEYFKFLNHNLGYVFIGKGHKESRYIGKTVYDAIVARTPVLVYKACDSGHITFESDEYYFSNEQELSELVKKLKDPETRTRWIKDQAKEIFEKLPPSEFKFSNYCSSSKKEMIPQEEFYVPVVIEKPVKKKVEKEIETVTKKAIVLF